MIQINTKIPDTRKLIHDLFCVQADFRRFLCDYFRHLQKEIPDKLCHEEQITALLERETCDAVLAKLRSHIEDLKEEDRFKEERYLEFLDEIDRVSQFSEPQVRSSQSLPTRRSRRPGEFLQWFLIACGILWLWKKICWVWAKINSIKVEGGTIVIGGAAGGGLFILIGRGPPPPSNLVNCPECRAPSVFIAGQAKRTVNFCAREITILQENEPRHPRPQDAVDSKQLQQIQQLIDHLNHLLTMYAPMEVPQSLSTIGPPGTLNWPHSAITECESGQTNRLPINLALKWKRTAEASVRNCFPNQNCRDAKRFTISCEFSYSITDQKGEYRCPKQSFSILSNGISFIIPPVLPIEQELQQVPKLEPNTTPTDIEFSTILNQCGGAFSAIALLAACKNP